MLQRLALIAVLWIGFQIAVAAPVQTIYSMQEVEQYVDRNTLVLFDLDNTLFEGKVNAYGHANWFNDYLEEGMAIGIDKRKIIEKCYPHWVLSQYRTEVKPVEEITPSLIKRLQTQGIMVLGLTSRQMALAQRTLEQIKSLDITFIHPSLPAEPIGITIKAPTLMQEGVIFCSDYLDKGTVLKTYLKMLGWTPKKLLIVDDGLSNLHSILQAFNDKSVEVVALHYPLVENRKKHSWYKQQARQAYYEAYLASDSLPPLFLEEKAKTDKQQQLLNANAAIAAPYEFSLFNKIFIGLPGVFSPTIFGRQGFADAIKIKKGISLLEIGPATGYFVVHAALCGAKKVVAVDISPLAVENTVLNAKRHQVEDKIDVRESDIFSAIHNEEKFDVIYWDIPFNHTEKMELSQLEHSVFDPNHHYLTRFMKEADRYLKANGVVYLGYSPTYGNIDYFYTLAKYYDWEVTVVKEAGTPDTIQITLFALTKKSV